MRTHRVSFPGTDFAALNLCDLASLPLHLTVQNSPLLFGCRSGLCGTCLIEVDVQRGTLESPDAAELEALAIYAPGNGNARLACQIVLSADIAIRKLQSV
jgi:ferredoxin